MAAATAAPACSSAVSAKMARKTITRVCMSALSPESTSPAGRLPAVLFAVPLVGLVQRVGLADVHVARGHVRQAAVVAVEHLQVALVHVLDVDQAVAGPLHGGHDLVELELNGQRLLVLAALDEEDHEEGDDGGPRVDGHLPGARIVEDGAGQEPQHDEARRSHEGRGTPREAADG